MRTATAIGLAAVGALGLLLVLSGGAEAQEPSPPPPPPFPPFPPLPLPGTLPGTLPLPSVTPPLRFKRSFEDLPVGAVVAVTDTHIPTPGGLSGPFPGSGIRNDYVIRSRDLSLDTGLWTYRGDSTSLLDRALTIRQNALIRESDIIARVS